MGWEQDIVAFGKLSLTELNKDHIQLLMDDTKIKGRLDGSNSDKKEFGYHCNEGDVKF